jgi:nucleoside-diphosphate-sugar epimerase
MRIAITGSNGFIGKELVSYFLSNSHEVVLLQRKQPQGMPVGVSYQPYHLEGSEVQPNLDKVDALIHTAYMPFAKGNDSSEKNIGATMALYNLCVSKGIQFVFLSSMSAHENALSEYGRHKYQLEKELDGGKCLILKLGLVIGKEGLFSCIYQSFQKMPFAVVVEGGKQPVQPVYIGDVVKVIAKCLIEKRTGIYTLAVNHGYTMKELFAAIAAKAGKKPIFISVPYGVVSFGISLIEILHLPFPVSQENLLGLKQLQSEDTSSDLNKLGVTLLALNESIQLL